MGAIKETEERAKELLFDAKGKRRDIRTVIGLWVFQVVLRKATMDDIHIAPGEVFDWQGTTRRYDVGNPAGRPKGSRNKVSEKLLEALAIDFDGHGKDVIEKVRAERPADYLKIVASLVPKQMEIDDLRTSRRAEDLSDDELAAIAAERLNGHPNLDG